MTEFDLLTNMAFLSYNPGYNNSNTRVAVLGSGCVLRLVVFQGRRAEGAFGFWSVSFVTKHFIPPSPKWFQAAGQGSRKRPHIIIKRPQK